MLNTCEQHDKCIVIYEETQCPLCAANLELNWQIADLEYAIMCQKDK